MSSLPLVCGGHSSLSKRQAFGLNFERHVPKSVELPVRQGDKERFLPECAACYN